MDILMHLLLLGGVKDTDTTNTHHLGIRGELRG